MSAPELALEDIQSGVLRPRPSPYAATYFIVRIDDPKAGRELIGRLVRVVSSAAGIGTTLQSGGGTGVAVGATVGAGVGDCVAAPVAGAAVVGATATGAAPVEQAASAIVSASQATRRGAFICTS